ncbi:MAG: hypothetical protein ACRCWC_11315 [Plesiomonas shigelloides]
MNVSDFSAPRHGKANFRQSLLPLSLLFAMGLVGCGGDDGDGSDTPPTPPSPAQQVFTVNGFNAVKPDVPSTVDLSSFVLGRGAELVGVTSEQPECNAPTTSGMKATFTISGGTLCRYNFTASNGKFSSRARLSLLASGAFTPVLTPLSHSMAVGSGSASLDVHSLLGADWPGAGYALDPASVQVDGGVYSASASATAAGNIITYVPPTSADWNRITFILKDPAQPTKDVLGSIYVTVSEAANTPPTIGAPKYDYNANNGGDPIKTFVKKTIDLATLPGLGITDPDGAGWQLAEVQSYSATVASAAPDDVSNTKFTFEAGTLGNHVVSYIIADYRGSFKMGVMNIKVMPDERPKDWTDVTYSTKTYFAPPLYSEVSSKNFAADGAWDDGVSVGYTPPGNTVATVSGDSAIRYCRSTSYRLPTKADLDALRAAPVGSAAQIAWSKYPKKRGYQISNDNGATYQTYDLATGAVGPYVADQYVMCVKYAGDGMISYTPRPNTPVAGQTNGVISDGSWWVLGDVTSQGGVIDNIEPTSVTNAGSTPLSANNFRLMPPGCAGGLCTLEANGSATELGSASINLVNANDSNQMLSVSPIKFLQNAKLTSFRTHSNNAPADGTSLNYFFVTVKDKNGNQLPAGTPVILNHSRTPASGNAVWPISGTAHSVDANGEIGLVMSSSNIGSVSWDVSIPGGIPGGLPSATINSNFVRNIKRRIQLRSATLSRLS